MQTYEVRAGESMESLAAKLTEMARTDRDITLVVPAQAEALQQVGNVSQLRQLVQSQGIRLQAVVADRVTLGLFRIMGLDAADSTDALPPPPAAPPAGENLDADMDEFERAVGGGPQVGLGSPPPGAAADDDVAGMNFDADELDQTLRAEGIDGAPARPAAGRRTRPGPAPAARAAATRRLLPGSAEADLHRLRRLHARRGGGELGRGPAPRHRARDPAQPGARPAGRL
jgi:hypothetical protein